MKEAVLPLSQLNLDLQNYRILPADGQREAIRAIIEEQDDYLVHLAEDIMDIGLSPAELLIVTPDEEEKDFYTVLEGNRRVTALKLMEVPSLAKDTALHSDFIKLGAAFAKKPLRSLRCVVVDTREEANPWIQRRHGTGLQGIGLEKWTSPASARFLAASGRVRRHKAVLDLLKKRGALDAKTERALQTKTTTMDRVFNTATFGDLLGVRIARDGEISFDNGKQKDGIALLAMIVKDMARPEWNVNHVRHEAQRLTYIAQFQAHAVTAPPKASVAPRTPTSPPAKRGSTPATAPSAPAKRGMHRDTLTRTTLANTRRDLAFPVKSTRLNRMYIESQKLRVETFKNAGGMLMRAFLEMSVEDYLTRHKVPLPAKTSATKWTDATLKLDQKVQCALDHIDPTGRDRQWLAVRQGINGNHKHSITSLHGFVHNVGTEPQADDLKQIWESWETFLRQLHA